MNTLNMNTRQWADAKQHLSSVRDWVRFGASCFEKAKLFYGHGTDNPWDEAVTLVLHALKLPHELGDKIIDCAVTNFEKDDIIQLFQQRIINRKPVPYITGISQYGGFEFYVDSRVLIPRSPLVELIENEFQPWIDALKVHSILDLGTGSGCLPILCAHYFPDALIDAVDIDRKALAVAKKNVAHYQLADHIHLIESDLFSALGNKSYDVIITNPPYVDEADMEALPAEYKHEPIHALASGKEGLDHIKTILTQAKQHLNPGGILIGEVGNSAAALEKTYTKLDFTWLEFQRGGEGVFLLTYAQLQRL